MVVWYGNCAFYKVKSGKIAGVPHLNRIQITTAMKEFNPVIAVANDFSSESKCAIAHAALFAKRDGSELLLIHILDNKAKKEAHMDEAIKTLLARQCAEIKAEYGIASRYVTPEGSIFKDIGETVKTENAKLLVMGTHGIQSLGERLLGSWALRIVDSSPVPTLIVQNKMPAAGGSYAKVIMQVDDSPESKILLKHAAWVHRAFGSEIVLFADYENDTYSENQVRHNLQFCQNTLEEAGIPFRVTEQKHGTDYFKNMVRYAAETYADLILIMANNDKNFADYLTEPEQKVIYNNAQIPVLCVTPMQNYVEENFSFSGLEW